MAQTGFTPIRIYSSSTTTNVPLATNLVAGELAINTADGKLFYKDSGNVVQVIGTKAAAAGTFATLSASGVITSTVATGTAPFTVASTTQVANLNAATAGTAGNVTGTVAVGNGGTGATTLTGVLKGNGTSAFTAATANTDYLVPALANTAVTGFKTATFNSQTTIATTTGAITIDWTTAQNQKQTEPTGTITYTFTAPPGVCHLQLLIDSDGTSAAQTFNWPGTVIWLGATWTATANKKSVINFWYDGTNYYGVGTTQV